MEAGSAIPYEEFESILYENLDIFTPNLRNPDARWIFPGKHVYKFSYQVDISIIIIIIIIITIIINVYKFSYQLPTDIPYTLDGSRYGRVEYKSKAELLIPGWNFFCLTTRCCFPIVCFQHLNYQPAILSRVKRRSLSFAAVVSLRFFPQPSCSRL